ncbi:hypothetical protein EVAR_17294_1 [Eumeta japonica]|uniref:Uncharacterized protein n=1 Tax=Eumeta variegata TaxID=151549 RepID=A0A4C1TT28_EUMVA|nr:hypothetical protein EVAR_17294_1 [Eumeta japonica]
MVKYAAFEPEALGSKPDQRRYKLYHRLCGSGSAFPHIFTTSVTTVGSSPPPVQREHRSLSFCRRAVKFKLRQRYLPKKKASFKKAPDAICSGNSVNRFHKSPMRSLRAAHAASRPVISL